MWLEEQKTTMDSAAQIVEIMYSPVASSDPVHSANTTEPAKGPQHWV